MKSNLVFLDTETTGLDLDQDDLVELSYRKHGDEVVRTFYFEHDISKMPDNVRKMTSYDERNVANRPKVTHDDIVFLRKEFEGRTMVAANPSFDSSFIRRYGLFTFHFRMLDIESFAMAKLRLDYMPGMKDIHKILSETYDFPAGDHTSAGDVVAMSTMYDILVQM